MTQKNREQFLVELVASGKADSFARYALALEYKKLSKLDEAIATFGELRKVDPAYVPMYLMAGQLLRQSGQTESAREWLKAGLEAARLKNDSKASSELSSLLAEIGGA